RWRRSPRRRWRAARRAALREAGVGSTSGAGFADHVVEPAHRADGALAELAAQVVHVHFHRVAGDFLAPAVEPLLELRARERLAGSVEQRTQQRELAARDADLAPLVEHLAAAGIEPEVAVLDQRLGAPRMTSEHGADARRQLVELERLYQVIIGA